MRDPLTIWKPPFVSDGCYIWSSNNVMALDIDNDQEDILDIVCKLLNGDDKVKPFKEVCLQSPVEIVADDYKLTVRGWGHLTGLSALYLPVEEAAEIQDKFVQWIIQKLQKKN